MAASPPRLTTSCSVFVVSTARNGSFAVPDSSREHLKWEGEPGLLSEAFLLNGIGDYWERTGREHSARLLLSCFFLLFSLGIGLFISKALQAHGRKQSN